MKASRLLTSLVIITYLISCSQKKGVDASGVEVRSFSTYMGEQIYQGYHTDSFSIYRTTYPYSSLEEVSGSDNKQFITKRASSQQKHRYFIFHKDSNYAYAYIDYPSMQRLERTRIDSAMHFVLGSNTFDSTNMKPARIERLNGKNAWKEIFTWKQQPAGSLHLYYLKDLNHLKESLNPKLDSIRKAKLFKYEIYMDAITDPRGKDWPPSVDRTEIKEIMLTDMAAWNAVIRAYSDFIRKSR